MADNQTIGITALITMLIVTAGSIVPGYFDTDKYYCESRPELGVVECDEFTKYVHEQGKCIRNEDTNLICRDGWKLVIDDQLPEEIEEEIPPAVSDAKIQVVCNQIECI